MWYLVDYFTQDVVEIESSVVLFDDQSPLHTYVHSVCDFMLIFCLLYWSSLRWRQTPKCLHIRTYGQIEMFGNGLEFSQLQLQRPLVLPSHSWGLRLAVVHAYINFNTRHLLIFSYLTGFAVPHSNRWPKILSHSYTSVQPSCNLKMYQGCHTKYCNGSSSEKECWIGCHLCLWQHYWCGRFAGFPDLTLGESKRQYLTCKAVNLWYFWAI